VLQELYKSIDKLRPKIFRMASELKENEGGMSDILQTNDSVLRVMDLYTAKIASLPPLPSSEGAEGASSNSTENAASKVDSATSGGDQVQSSSSEVTTAAQQNGTLGATGGGSDSDVLIDLADLNFDPVGTSDGASGGTSELNSSLGLGSLLDDISALGEWFILVT
jgi:hypothetical protein